MEQSARPVATELVDLTQISIERLRTCDESLLGGSLDRIMQQVERPRGNISESGPPGRAD